MWGSIVYFSPVLAVELALVGLVVLVVVTRAKGRSFLQRWGLGRPPTQEETTAVRRHVQLRRGVTVATLVLLGLVLGARDRAGDDGLVPEQVRWVVALMVGLLAGELVAVLRQRGRTVRTASLTPRPAAVLVPAWARWGVRGGLALSVVLTGVVALQARYWGGPLSEAVTSVDRNDPATVARLAELPQGWAAVLVGAVLVLLVVELVVHLAVTRPAGGAASEEVDLLLRARAARVATGAGLGLAGFLVAAALSWSHQRVESLGLVTSHGDLQIVWQNTSGAGPFVVLLLGVLGWIVVGNPPGRPVLSSVRLAHA